MKANHTSLINPVGLTKSPSPSPQKKKMFQVIYFMFTELTVRNITGQY
jgi:hypothetical protein